MAVRRKQYAEELEKQLNKGKTLKVAKKIASKLASTTHPLGKMDSPDKPSLADRAILKGLKYLKKKKKPIRYRRKK